MEDYKKMFDGLSDDLKKKAMECKNAEGIELSDEQMNAISGGVQWSCSGDDWHWVT